MAITVSYSGISMYKDCPSAFYRKYVAKEEGGAPPTRETAPAMFRGTDLHNAIEEMILGKRERLPKELSGYDGFVKQLADLGAKPEVAFAWDANWEATGFDAEDAAIRGFYDCKVVTPKQLTIYEWKTGKVYPEHVTQRHLYGMSAMLEHPEHESVNVITTYLDLMENMSTTYHSPMLSTYKWMWTKYINKCQPPQPYPMRPSWKCRTCQFSKKNGGKCPN